MEQVSDMATAGIKRPTVLQTFQKRKLVRPGMSLSLRTGFLVILLVASTLLLFVHASRPTWAAASFSFSAAGDYGETQHTTANLRYMGNLAKSGAVSFNLALGDLNYDSTTVTAEQWSNYVKGYLPSNFPFEIEVGEHDTTQINDLAVDLPDQIGDVVGTYAKEYYFDYPPVAPLARFIMVSPGILPGANYKAGGADYNWVANTIDAARAKNIPWVIVGIHKYCIAISSQGCTAPDLLNLLLTKKVDLILHGQKHGYQASYQLALNSTTCPLLPTTVGSYNANCVVNNRSASFTKGAGTIILITGTGGKAISNIDPSDLQAGYFRTWMAGNANPTWGISQFTLSANQLTEQFDTVSGGTFTDSFTISKAGFTPTPSPSPTLTPSPSPTPGTTLAQDTFQRPNQLFWGTASDQQVWGANANSLKVFTINNNAGQVAASSSTSYNAVLGPVAADAKVQFSGTLSSFTGTNLGAVLRWTDSKNWYKAFIDGSSLVIQKKVNGTNTRLASAAFPATNGTSYTLLFRVVGQTLSASVWPTGGSQPSSWMVTTTDSDFSSGYCGLHMLLTSGVIADITSFQATSQ